MAGAVEEGRKGKVTVVGGGLVGALEACYLAKRGYEVHLYEYRKDIRTLDYVPGKSINMAMSVRGFTAMGGIGMAELMRDNYGIPMGGRMIHPPCGGPSYPVPYGKKGQCIYSVSRRDLNESLLTAGEKFPNLHIHFEHKLLSFDPSRTRSTFLHQGKQVEVDSDFVIGCDGAYSVTRQAFMKRTDFNFSQEYIPHSYKELCIPKGKDGEFKMPPNYLHIWPRGNFMLIALPNLDKTFTVTLFMPTNSYNDIQETSDLVAFFEDYFPDAVPLIGKERLEQDYFAGKPLPLISVKCRPYNWEDKCLLLGDAAHAMVPFYGQGMNCGMEDVLVLDQMLDQFKDDLLKAFNEYSRHRNPDAEAICDLAMYNYVEMRDLVAKPSFLLRKKFDNLLYWLFPRLWIPLYTTVTFSRMRYHHCILNRDRQDKIVHRLLYIAVPTMILSASGLSYIILRGRISGLFFKASDILQRILPYKFI